MDKSGIDRSRRAFLFGAPVSRPRAMRPPWSLDERDFAAACTGCGDCLTACPESILILDANQVVAVDFTQGQNACTFCGACAEICTAPAFLAPEQRGMTASWTWRARVTDNCLTHEGVMCQSCKDACGDRAISFAYGVGRVAQPVIDLDLCTGCGACQAPCPAAAIAFVMMEPVHAA